MNKTNKNIVTYEIGLKLKNLGFKEDVYYNITNSGLLLSNGFLLDWNQYHSKVSAPRLSEVVDWLYEKFNIFITFEYLRATVHDYNKFKCIVLDLNKEAYDGDLLFISKTYFKTKEEALVDAIENTINILCNLKKINIDVNKQSNTQSNNENLGVKIPCLATNIKN